MFLSCSEIAQKYALDGKYVTNVLNVHSEVTKHYDRSLCPFWMYNEDEALEAIMGDMCCKAHEAFVKSQEWEGKARGLENKLREMGYFDASGAI